MNCKFCNAELEEGVTLCPSCGKDNAAQQAEPVEAAEGDSTQQAQPVIEDAPVCEAPVQEAPAVEVAEPKKKGKGWIAALSIALCVVLLAGIGAGIWYYANGGWAPRANDLNYKDSYTVSDDKAVAIKDTVVATVADRELTNSQLQLFYWMQFYNMLDYYGSYLSYYVDMDYTKPLDQQPMDPELLQEWLQDKDLANTDNITWQKYFLDSGLGTWHRYQAMALLAEEAGYELSEAQLADLETLPEQMNATAEENGYEDADALLQSEMGAGCTMDAYVEYLKLYYLSFQYYEDQYSKIDPSDAEIEAYFDEHGEELDVDKDAEEMADVRHILVCVEGGTENEDGDTVYSDAEWAACRAEAQAILDQWLAGEKTEASFADLANAKSEDGGSNTNGGLYTGIDSSTNFVPAFKNWCLNEDRKPGDYELVQTEYGYHIMYFVGRYEPWYVYSRAALITELSNQMMDAALEKFPMAVSFNKIGIGFVDFSQA